MISELVKKDVAKVMGNSSNDAANSRERNKSWFLDSNSATDATVIKDTLNDFLLVCSRRSEVVKVDALTDPAAIGFIKFESVPAKKGFYKILKEQGVKFLNGKTFGLDNNEPFAVKKLSKQLGQVNLQINATTEN